MKTIKTIIIGLCAVAVLTVAGIAEQAACCKKAAEGSKACTHKCCVAAAKDGKECEKCGGKGEIKKPEKKGEKKSAK